MMASGIAEPSLVMMRVLSRSEGAAGVLVTAVAGLDGLEAILDTTLVSCSRELPGVWMWMWSRRLWLLVVVGGRWI